MEFIMPILFIILVTSLFIAIRLLNNAYKELEELRNEKDN